LHGAVQGTPDSQARDEARPDAASDGCDGAGGESNKQEDGTKSDVCYLTAKDRLR
jgi:hypothetical protein